MKSAEAHVGECLERIRAREPEIRAWAYLDPGTGSMIAQVVIGAIAAALVSIKLAWRRIKRAFLSLFGREGEPDADPKRGN